MAYKPSKPFTTPLLLYPVTGTKNELGKRVKTYAEQGELFFGSFATYGGTERDVNGVYSVEDTAVVETWYRPDFAASGRVALADNPAKLYDIIGEPEDIEQRHQYSRFKLSRVKGGA
jgi:hypothetical protein